jgi:hypothetical protein
VSQIFDPKEQNTWQYRNENMRLRLSRRHCVAGDQRKNVRQIEAEPGITPGLLNQWKQRYQLRPATGEVKPSNQRDLEDGHQNS